MVKPNRVRMWLIFPSAAILSLGMLTTESLANPNFSRKYKINCSTCHTVVPQLTRTGIEFRRLGYRFPNELKQESLEPAPAHGQEQGMQSNAAIKTMTAAGCATCHAIESGQSGSSLQGVGAKLNADQIRAFLPSDSHPGTEIAKAVTPQDLDIIVAYLATLTEPGEANDPWAYDFSRYISVRGRTRYNAQKVKGTNSTNEFRYNDMTAYYLGPVNKKLTVFFETEYEQGFDPNVLAQGTLLFGNPDRYVYLKVGNMRLVRQGVGLLDRPKTISTDLAVSSRAHLFALNTDQRGVEAGYGFNKNRTVVRGFVMNGIDMTGNGRPVGRQDVNTQKDVALIVENLFGAKTATSVSALYYNGHTPYSATTNTTFYRLGLFGALALNNAQNFEDVRLSGGVLYGSDDVPGNEPGDKNLGLAVGLDKRLGEQFYISSRYDQFRPTDRVSDNTTKSYTVGLIKQMFTYLRLSAEYQRFQRPQDINDNRYTAEFFLFF